MTTELAEPLVLSHTALLVMDFQAGLLSRLPQAEELLRAARQTIDLVRRHGMTVAYVRVAFADGEAPGGRMGKLVTPELLASVHVDAPGSQIHSHVAPQPDDIVVRKVRVGPFGSTDLDEQLRAKGIDTVVLAGLTTSGVVLTAVRDAHDRDYRVIVLADLTADPDPSVQNFLLERIFPLQAEVITSDELRRSLG
ncbi:MAG: cysteine hydrolase [Actinomycetota bacterium]|nr:cysteine hydrolase [Actinomycetota bacterium]